MTTPTEQKARECADILCKQCKLSLSYRHYAEQIILRHFTPEERPKEGVFCTKCGYQFQTTCLALNLLSCPRCREHLKDQPDKSEDELAEKWAVKVKRLSKLSDDLDGFKDIIKQANIEAKEPLKKELKEVKANLNSFSDTNFRQASKIDEIQGYRKWFAGELLKLIGIDPLSEEAENVSILESLKTIKQERNEAKNDSKQYKAQRDGYSAVIDLAITSLQTLYPAGSHHNTNFNLLVEEVVGELKATRQHLADAVKSVLDARDILDPSKSELSLIHCAALIAENVDNLSKERDQLKQRVKELEQEQVEVSIILNQILKDVKEFNNPLKGEQKV